MNVDVVLARLGEAVGASSLEELAAFLEKDVKTLRVWRFRQHVPASAITLVSKRTGKPVAWLEAADVREGAVHKVNERLASFFVRKEKQVNLSSRMDDEFFLVPEVDVRASAGPGQIVDSEEVIGKFAFRRSWLRQKGVRPETLAVVRATGNSMAPTVCDGDILLVDRAVESLSVDGIYLIEQFNSLQCKRLELKWGEGVLIKSDNPAIPDQQLSFEQAESLRVAGKVIWIGGER